MGLQLCEVGARTYKGVYHSLRGFFYDLLTLCHMATIGLCLITNVTITKFHYLFHVLFSFLRR